MKKENVLIDSDMAKRIYDTRKNKKLTQEKLSENAGICELTIKRIEKCKNGTTYLTTTDTIRKIASALGVSFRYIVGDLLLENNKKLSEFADRWDQVIENNEPWIRLESGSGWNGKYDEMNISCYDFPVDKLVLSLCAAGARDLILSGLKQYDEIAINQK